MDKVSSVISSCLDKYLSGEIADSYRIFKFKWDKLNVSKYEEEQEAQVFYRLRRRKEYEEEFEIKDLLHIPINKREVINNQRYSINGFPCLYASTSIYQCWEELRRPNLMNLYAAGLMFTENMRFLDLRLIRPINNESQLRTFLLRLPLIIACSIKVRNDNATFKPEYIIPQILLHTIINNKSKIDGILYSSMRKDYEYYNKAEPNIEDCSRNENIVVPAKVVCESSKICDKLLRQIEISQPLNFEQELIKGAISFEKYENYNNTIFGQMESILMSSRTFYPENPNKFNFCLGEGFPMRIKRPENNICLI